MDQDCPSEQAVADYLAHQMSSADAASLEVHIGRCEACRQLVSVLVHATGSDAIAGATTLDRMWLAAKLDDLGGMIGARIGRYELTRLLGAGAMGVVYAAHDPGLDREVALKFLRDISGASPRLLREGQALARLSHPNVVAIYDVGEHEGHVFIAMELVVGTTLAGWLDQQPRTLSQVVDVFVQAGRGLAAVHRAGFVHRDFKPDNVLIGQDGRTRVTDFGLARLGEAPTASPPPRALVAQMTRTGALVGTPAYMAPEQLDGRPADARADQFAFCVALFEALRGQRPFSGDTIQSLRASIAMALPRTTTRRLPRGIARTIARGLSEDPADRFPTTDALLDDLERGRRLRRRRATVAGVVGLAAGAMALVLLTRGSASPDCDDARARLAGVWDSARKRSIQDALLATGQPYAADAWRNVERTLDRYTSTWTRLHVEACRATHVGEQSQELLDLKMTCLGQRLDRVQALGDALAAGGVDAARSAVNAAHSLEPLEPCDDAIGLRAVTPPPSDPVARARLDRARHRLADAAALLDAGKTERARSLVDEVGELGFAPLDAERWLLIGKTERVAGDFPAALAAYRASTREADTGGADNVRIDAMVELIETLGVRQGRPQQAFEIAKDAEAFAARTHVALARARILRAEGAVLRQMGRYGEAIRDQRAALAEFERALGPDHPLVATACSSLGVSILRGGSANEAMAMMQRAYAIREAALGPLHPDTLMVIANTALPMLLLGEFADAERTLRQALQAARASLTGGCSVSSGAAARRISEYSSRARAGISINPAPT